MRPASILFLPLAAFLNIQCAQIPGWLASRSFFNHCAKDNDIQYFMDPIIKRMVLLSAWAGIVANASLFFRLMLEKKIKAWTRIIIFSSATQGIFSAWGLLIFIVQYSTSKKDLIITEAPIYAFLAAVLSFWTVALILKLQEQNCRNDHYNYLMDLSPSYRQLILLVISSMGYSLGMAQVYCWIEGWSFDDSLYWVISTLTTIGYGDVSPSTILGKVLLIFFSLPGITLFGSTIWAIR